MKKINKTIIITVIAILAIALIIGIVCLVINNKNNEIVDNNGITKISKIYNQIKSNNEYSFSLTVDEKNKMIYAKKGEQAYVNSFYEGEETKMITKNGNSYLIKDQYKKYYEYPNSTSDLTKILSKLEELQDKEYNLGKEKIQNKTYNYIEYTGYSEFLVQYISNMNESTVKTRFYFDGDDLVYIKTIAGTKEETAEVKISNQVDATLFNIPSDYQK